MIISASRRTDIPAFYSEWFMNRIREGYLYVQNPFNTNKFKKVDLSPSKVDAIVFWSKNPRPLMPYLHELDERGYKYYFQFTITGYPKIIEPSVPALDEVIGCFIELSNKIGSDRVIWRFDPIMLSDITNEDFIFKRFNFIAEELKEYTNQVIISFADFYKKVITNLNKFERERNTKFKDITGYPQLINKFALQLAEIASKNYMQILSCSEKYDLSRYGIKHGKCIDDELIEKIAQKKLNVRKDINQREECGCVQSQDIGQYNTCLHNCVYCYATYNKEIALKNKAKHNPQSPSILDEKKLNITDDSHVKNKQLDFLTTEQRDKS